jgi:uncharacterized protein YbjT (DUF2867 family)
MNVLILGANGSIARIVTDLLEEKENIHLTLFLRNAKRLKGKGRIIEGDVLNFNQLKEAVQGQDVVYANLAGDLEEMAQNIVKAMKETGVKRIIFISSIGIYDSPVKPVLEPYRKAVDVIESSGLEFTILRPAWFSNENEVDYEITRKGEPERGSVISRKSLATVIAEMIASPEEYIREDLGINKPGT